MPFHGSSTSCSPSSIALARTTSSSAVSRATLPISLRYIRTGSSIPIMSAESASSSAAVGSSSSSGVELRRRVDRELRGARLGVLADDLDGRVVVVVVAGERRRRARRRVLVLVLVDLVEGGAGRAEAGELGLLEVGLAPPGAGQDGFDELLVKGIDWHGGLPPGG